MSIRDEVIKAALNDTNRAMSGIVKSALIRSPLFRRLTLESEQKHGSTPRQIDKTFGVACRVDQVSEWLPIWRSTGVASCEVGPVVHPDESTGRIWVDPVVRLACLLNYEFSKNLPTGFTAAVNLGWNSRVANRVARDQLLDDYRTLHESAAAFSFNVEIKQPPYESCCIPGDEFLPVMVSLAEWNRLHGERRIFVRIPCSLDAHALDRVVQCLRNKIVQGVIVPRSSVESVETPFRNESVFDWIARQRYAMKMRVLRVLLPADTVVCGEGALASVEEWGEMQKIGVQTWLTRQEDLRLSPGSLGLIGRPGTTPLSGEPA